VLNVEALSFYQCKCIPKPNYSESLEDHAHSYTAGGEGSHSVATDAAADKVRGTTDWAQRSASTGNYSAVWIYLKWGIIS